LLLSQAGEFSLIVFGKAGSHGIVSPEQLSIVAGIVILSLILTPSLFAFSKYADELGKLIPSAPWVKKTSFQQQEEELLSASGEHVIIAGYGPVGRQASAVLAEQGMCFTVVELNSTTVKREKANGLNIVYGDIANESLLSAVKAESARAILLTFPDAKKAIETAQVARAMNPEIEIVARASSTEERARLEATEIDDAVVDEELSAKAMVEFAQQLTRRAK
ncbi:MAG: NAD-binding protein, partial [Bdellovibrionales bacterium]|nr:NAD-binding protein [Bdellovibrionales bacterium]